MARVSLMTGRSQRQKWNQLFWYNNKHPDASGLGVPNSHLLSYPHILLYFIFAWNFISTWLGEVEPSPCVRLSWNRPWLILQGLANIFCEGLNSKYFQLCRPYGLCHNYSLRHCNMKAAIQYVKKMSWLSSNKTLFIKTESKSHKGCSLMTSN